MWRPDGPFMHDTAWWASWQGAVMIGLLILIAGLLTWLAVSAKRGPEGPVRADGDEAVAAARMRYARGELDRDAYAQVVLDLTGGSPVTAEGTGSASGDAVSDAAGDAPSDAPETPPAAPA